MNADDSLINGKYSKHSNINVDYNMKYGAIPFQTEYAEVNLSATDDFETDLDERSRRWSVLEKIDRRHYCGRIRSVHDCLHIVNSKCLLATIMLIVFIVLAIEFSRAVFLNVQVIVDEGFDVIIIGAGPGKRVMRRLDLNNTLYLYFYIFLYHT